MANKVPYSTEYEDVLERIKNKGEFSYDPSSDKLYQQYKNMAHQSGSLAMKDTVGRASALTGGYGNSYAQTAGQQAYNSYMQQADAVIPELYQLAYNKHNSELSNLYSQLDGYEKLMDNASEHEYEPIDISAIAGAVAAYGNGNTESLTDYLDSHNYDNDKMRALVQEGQGWYQVHNGNARAGWIDDNAKIRVGETTFNMRDFYKALKDAGMDWLKARNYVEELQKKTGISD